MISKIALNKRFLSYPRQLSSLIKPITKKNDYDFKPIKVTKEEDSSLFQDFFKTKKTEPDAYRPRLEGEDFAIRIQELKNKKVTLHKA